MGEEMTWKPISSGVGEGPLERVLYNGFPSRSSFFIICFCFLDIIAMKGRSSAKYEINIGH